MNDRGYKCPTRKRKKSAFPTVSFPYPIRSCSWREEGSGKKQNLTICLPNGCKLSKISITVFLGMIHLSLLAKTTTSFAPFSTDNLAASTPEAPDPIMTTFLPFNRALSSWEEWRIWPRKVDWPGRARGLGEPQVPIEQIFFGAWEAWSGTLKKRE